MGSLLLQPEMEAPLEWVLLLAMGGSGLCMFALATMMIITRYRMRKASWAAKQPL